MLLSSPSAVLVSALLAAKAGAGGFPPTPGNNLPLLDWDAIAYGHHLRPYSPSAGLLHFDSPSSSSDQKAQTLGVTQEDSANQLSPLSLLRYTNSRRKLPVIRGPSVDHRGCDYHADSKLDDLGRSDNHVARTECTSALAPIAATKSESKQEMSGQHDFSHPPITPLSEHTLPNDAEYDRTALMVSSGRDALPSTMPKTSLSLDRVRLKTRMRGATLPGAKQGAATYKGQQEIEDLQAPRDRARSSFEDYKGWEATRPRSARFRSSTRKPMNAEVNLVPSCLMPQEEGYVIEDSNPVAADEVLPTSYPADVKRPRLMMRDPVSGRFSRSTDAVPHVSFYPLSKVPTNVRPIRPKSRAEYARQYRKRVRVSRWPSWWYNDLPSVANESLAERRKRLQRFTRRKLYLFSLLDLQAPTGTRRAREGRLRLDGVLPDEGDEPTSYRKFLARNPDAFDEDWVARRRRKKDSVTC